MTVVMMRAGVGGFLPIISVGHRLPSAFRAFWRSRCGVLVLDTFRSARRVTSHLNGGSSRKRGRGLPPVRDSGSRRQRVRNRVAMANMVEFVSFLTV